MIVLGIDPGSKTTGYALLHVEPDSQSILEYGICRVGHHDAHELRLLELYQRISEIIARLHPDECAVEMPVYGKNPQSMLKLGRAQAAAMLAALNQQVPVVQYTPKEVKKAVTGNGNASKQQVWYMVRSILTISDAEELMNHDSADAIAVGLCHIHRQGNTRAKAKGGWKAFLSANPERVRK